VKFVIRTKMLENVSVNLEIKLLKALKFSGGKLRPFSSGFHSYDRIALASTIVTFLHGGIDIPLIKKKVFQNFVFQCSLTFYHVARIRCM